MRRCGCLLTRGSDVQVQADWHVQSLDGLEAYPSQRPHVSTGAVNNHLISSQEPIPQTIVWICLVTADVFSPIKSLRGEQNGRNPFARKKSDAVCDKGQPKHATKTARKTVPQCWKPRGYLGNIKLTKVQISVASKQRAGYLTVPLFSSKARCMSSNLSLASSKLLPLGSETCAILHPEEPSLKVPLPA